MLSRGLKAMVTATGLIVASSLAIGCAGGLFGLVCGVALAILKANPDLPFILGLRCAIAGAIAGAIGGVCLARDRATRAYPRPQPKPVLGAGIRNEKPADPGDAALGGVLRSEPWT